MLKCLAFTMTLMLGYGAVAGQCNPGTLRHNEWTQIDAGTPPARSNHAMAYHAATDQLVSATGANSGGYFDETWVWDGESWSLAPVRNPPVRIDTEMVYDSNREVIVLFGGAYNTGFGWIQLGDTWEWDGESWTEVDVSGPPPRVGHAIAYDEQRGVVVLQGGANASEGNFEDTWEYDGSSWTQTSTSGPGDRYDHAMAYDVRHQRTVLYGGYGAGTDTWAYDAGVWTRIATTGPAGQSQHTMAWDPRVRGIVLLGRQDGSFINETWVLEGADWRLVNQTGPSARIGHQTAFVSSRCTLVLYGGFELDSHQYLDDTWRWDPAVAGACSPADNVLENGDLDDLKSGTPPDCGDDAGAWGWPKHYITAGLCESAPTQFQIVASDTFDAGAAGNALHLDVESSATHHLPNLFDPILESPGEIVVVTFDIWVIERGEKGGNFYVSGDHGAGGYGAGIDRGPQIGWQADGTLTRAPGDEPEPVVLLEDYPVGVWQTVRLEIDLASDNYDIYWATTGEPLILLEADAPFHSGAKLDHLDRVTVVHFPVLGTVSKAYFDNFCVQVLPVPGDIDGDGKVGFGDLLILLANWGDCPDPPAECPADLDDSGDVGFPDLLVVLSSWTG